MKKRVILLTLIFLMTACFWGCGEKKQSGTTAGTASKDYVYRMEDLDVKAVRQISRSGEDIYVYGNDWQDDGSSVLYFYKINEDGTVAETFSFPVKQSTNLRNISLDDEGSRRILELEME